MIEWKRYDKDNPPERDNEFLIYDYVNKRAWIARLEEYEGQYHWIEIGTAELNNFVTHYAEINLP